MTTNYSMAALNSMSADEFTAALGAIYEHSPWVARRAAAQRPFADLGVLRDTMAGVVRSATEAERLKLIQAHPELAGQAAVRGELTQESTREQKGAGLDLCDADEYDRLHTLNRQYNEKFGFPFVVAVKGHDRHSILALFAARLGNAPADEARECIDQIVKIGGLRLAASVA
jgi:2-oxo-4-hydroxy-4-carboxy-5-ureidoimidazoline decarboxylase